MFSIYIIFGSLLFFNPNLNERFLSMNDEVAIYSGLKLKEKLWKKSLKVIKDSSIYGYSLGNYGEELMNEYKQTNFRRALRNKYNSHNQYLPTLLISGVIELIFFLHLLFGSIPEIVKSKDYIYLLFVMVLFLSAITESVFQRQFGIMLFSFMNFTLYAFLVNRKIHDKHIIS